MRICIVGVYFGKFPDYIDAWLKSCESNSDIDFWVFGDAKLPRDVKNVHKIFMTLADMKTLIEDKLERRVCLNRPYKCCDYKPLYGYIFSEYLSEYDYCGYCDFDVIFGDITHFLDKYCLYQYDKFLTLGHLSFIKNSNEIYEYVIDGKKNPVFEQMISTDDVIQFDELEGINSILIDGGFKIFDARIYADISRLWKRIKLAEKYVTSKDKNYRNQLFYWNNGKVFRAYVKNRTIFSEEYMYIHLKKRKYRALTEGNYNLLIITPDALLVKDTRVYHPSKRDIKQYNPYYGVFYEWIEWKILSRSPKHIVPKGRALE